MTPDELRALLEKATAGPWEYRYEMVDELHGSALGNVLTRGDRENYWMGKPDPDGPLIVALRNHAEALLELWEASAAYARSDMDRAAYGRTWTRILDALGQLEAIE